jgi:hypothetical protein
VPAPRITALTRPAAARTAQHPAPTQNRMISACPLVMPGAQRQTPSRRSAAACGVPQAGDAVCSSAWSVQGMRAGLPAHVPGHGEFAMSVGTLQLAGIWSPGLWGDELGRWRRCFTYRPAATIWAWPDQRCNESVSRGPGTEVSGPGLRFSRSTPATRTSSGSRHLLASAHGERPVTEGAWAELPRNRPDILSSARSCWHNLRRVGHLPCLRPATALTLS